MISNFTISQNGIRGLLFTMLFAVLSGFSFAQDLVINEFLASNGAGIVDEFGENEDWVEIYNAGAVAVDIGGMYFTDDLNEPTLWQIPATAPDSTTIPPQGFLIVWFDKDTEQGVLHVKAKLSTSGEQIGLFAGDGVTVIDSITFGVQTEDISYGRTVDGGDEWRFFNTPTPHESNGNAPDEDFATQPVASVEGGFFNSSFSLTLTSATPNATIYFTTDGSQPDNTDALYTSPITIDRTTTLRAITLAPGYLPSTITTHTYFLDVSHTFPVVALSFEPADFFDDATGIYTNFNENWERPVNVEFFETDGSLAFNQAANAEIHGSASAELQQKSIALKSKSSAGAGTFDYPIFPDMEYNSYKRFIIRNSGQDFPYTTFRDAMASSLVRDLSDVEGKINRPRLNLQGYRPGVAYFNGQYWGIYNIRERIDKKYIKQHFGLSSNEIDFLDQRDEVKAGDLNLWHEFMDFLDSHDMSDDANFDQLKTMLDVDEYMDYIIFDLFIDNWDWPANNVKRWRARAEGGKWHYVVTDLDFSFGMFNPWNGGNNSNNSLQRLFNDEGWDWPNAEWATRPFRKCVENDTWRNDFINRMADQLNVLYNPDRINERINNFETTYQAERQKHVCRWFDCWDGSAQNIEILRTFANGRDDVVRQHFVQQFDNINGTANITIKATPAAGGTVTLNTVHLSETDFPWTGTYFTNIDIPINVKPARGYIFDHWSGANEGNIAESTVNLQESATLTAHFRLGSTSTIPIVINEINYHSADAADAGDWVELYNPAGEEANLSGWTFEDESGYYFQIPDGTVLPPEGYLVLAKDLGDFQAIYPGITNVIGSFGDGETGFKLSNKDEKISLLNAAGVVIDTVHYYDSAPWPEAADGDGPSLQLKEATLDNALASSWLAEVPTPGRRNTTTGSGCPTDIAGYSFLGEYNDHHYFLSENVSLWEDANNQAIGYDGYLVAINDENENIFLKDQVNEIVLIGLTDATTEGDLGWSNGETLDYTHFSICEFCGLNTEFNDYGVMNHWDGSWSFVNETVLKKHILEIGCGTTVPDTLLLVCPDDMVFEPVDEGHVNPTWDEPVATTTCDGAVIINQTEGPPPGFPSASGEYDIAYEAMDNCGDTASCSFHIEVIVPFITPLCPNDIVVAATNTDGVIVEYPSPTYETNLPDDANIQVNLVSGIPSGGSFPVGTTNIEYEFIHYGYDLILSCTFSITVEPANPSDCGEINGFTKLGEYNSHGYYLSNTAASWEEAKNLAENNGGYLATINSQAENDFVKSGLDHQLVFIGYNDAATEGTGEWANGEPVTLDLSYSNTEFNDYAVMNFWAGSWQMVNPFVVKSYIMEKTCGATSTCPVNLVFHNQFEIDNFSSDYPGCVDIAGDVTISEISASDITGLQGLSQIHTIGGSLNVSGLQSLSNLEGLNGLVSIGDDLHMYNLSALSNLTGLDNLAEVSNIFIKNNENLVSLTGLDHLNPGFVQSMEISDNPQLSECAIQPVCEYLNLPDAQMTVFANAQGCHDTMEIEQACGTNPCDNIEGFEKIGEYEGHGYYLSNEKMTWTTAKTLAHDAGGYLVTINSEAENSFIGNNIPISAFIGLNDVATEGNPVWENGETPVYTNFGTCSICGQNTEEKDFGIFNSWDYSWGFVSQYVSKYAVMEMQCGEDAITRLSSAILDLETKVTEGACRLHWVNNTGEKNQKFILEKSADGIEFKAFDEINSLTENGVKVYQRLDNHPVKGDNYYRVKVIFKDGSVMYSPSRMVTVKFDIDAVGLYPNPATNQVFLYLKPHVGEQGEVLIYNAFGLLVHKYHFDKIPEAPFAIDITEYHNGLYFFKIKINGYRQQTIRLAVQSTR